MADIPRGILLPDRNRMSVLNVICEFFQLEKDQISCPGILCFTFAENADNQVSDSQIESMIIRLRLHSIGSLFDPIQNLLRAIAFTLYRNKMCSLCIDVYTVSDHQCPAHAHGNCLLGAENKSHILYWHNSQQNLKIPAGKEKKEERNFNWTEEEITLLIRVIIH